MRHDASWRRWLPAVVLAAGCATHAPSSQRGEVRSTAANALETQVTRRESALELGRLEREGTHALDQLSKHVVPAGVERLALDLEAAADHEGEGPRADQAMLMAADLYAARHALTHTRDDVAKARARYARVARRKSAWGCKALARGGDLALAAGEPDRAKADFQAFQQRCTKDENEVHVAKALAQLAPPASPVPNEPPIPLPPLTGPGEPAHGIRRIVIDPGHGGSDPGAMGPTGLSEARVTLDVGRRVADYVSAEMGADVMLTRDTDEFVPLEERTARANLAQADLFVSIHCNSSLHPDSHGLSAYVLDTNSDQVAARVAVREGDEYALGWNADPALFRILADLRLVGQGSRSMQLAQSIQANLLASVQKQYGDVMDLGIHPARFNVLVGARMPAVLVELSFVSNPLEESRLRSLEYRDLLARAIVSGIARSGL